MADDDAQRQAEALGRRLKEYREQAGFGVNQLAEYSNVSGAYISRIERGKVPRPSLLILGRLADKLHVTVDEIRHGRDSGPDGPLLGDQELDLQFRELKEEELTEDDLRYLREQARLVKRMARERREAAGRNDAGRTT